MPTRTSLSRSFMRAILISCSAVLLITSATFFTYDLISYRQNGLQQLQTLGAAVASNSTAALAFQNVPDAEQVLAALRADPGISAAALYDADGRLFARYPPGSDSRRLPAAPAESGYRLRGLTATAFHPVVERERQLGTLYVQSGEITGIGIGSSIAMGSISAAVLVANNLRDIPTDAVSGKRTLAVGGVQFAGDQI